MIHIFAVCEEEIPYNEYCVNHVEVLKDGSLLSRDEYFRCTPHQDPWLEDVEINLFSGLYITSMIFLILLFVVIFTTQRKKLFG